ncbi:MAG: Gfo/Idh/MocA family oxidoreductase [Bryobacteraceae bacterium]|nr:Gfo/Idh/MocA family oxidoreductase [Bryobacteraceae bacterium]
MDSRRTFLTGAAAAFTILKPELVRGAGKEKLKAGLVGCGGRGSQAAIDLLTAAPNVELAAMGDVFEDKLTQSLERMKRDRRYGPVADRIKVSPEKRFTGFDAFKKIAASDVDIVMLCTPPGYRPEHFEAAVNAGKHVFCEKPIATDPVGVRRFLAANEKAREKKLTVVSGAQNRFTPWRMEQVEQIKRGDIGEIVATYASYIVDSPVFHAQARDSKWGDMEWQHRNWYSFVWICGDQIVEQHFHNIDFVNWVMGTHPVKVVASGGAIWRPREELYGNIYDHMACDFEYANGVRLTSHCRQYPRGVGPRKVGEAIVGSKGKREFYQMPRQPGMPNPQELEHAAMVKSIMGDGPYINHGREVAESTLTCIMGRESAYAGIEVTWDMILNSKQDLQPKAFDYDLKMEDAPLPVPGKYKFS